MAERKSQYFPEGNNSKFTTKIRKDANGRIKSSRVPVDDVDEEVYAKLRRTYLSFQRR